MVVVKQERNGHLQKVWHVRKSVTHVAATDRRLGIARCEVGQQLQNLIEKLDCQKFTWKPRLHH